ncbi:cytochrome c3 family protein [Algisphaera agarilytica]|uniref:Cytochrome c553 n=1 Tax=Algisphaera agarilytica TaxID=1385975 RepID=A0A7X0H7W8_9BACT|nr:cytochrome c3 family protein [Algisphaera agarilytica]MBB6429444.1 cytochrome c553 [Algisphaera agarilytica]
MTDQEQSNAKFVFPRWANYLLPLILLGAMGGAVYVPAVVGLGLNPNTLNQNYQPKQPIPYSHELHVGQLGLDCTYCHTSVNQAGFAAIPPVETCITCHNPGAGSGVKKLSPKLEPLHRAYLPYLDRDTGYPTTEAGPEDRPNLTNPDQGKPIEWIKVHDIADYAYFNHSAHVTKGVSCVSCHGRVDRMGEEGVYQVENLSMGWCLECHRAPEKHLRPPSEVTNLSWTPLDDPEVIEAIKAGEIKEGDVDAAQLLVGLRVKEQYNVHNAAYMQSCSTCHR